jgi:hypothetical protein
MNREREGNPFSGIDCRLYRRPFGRLLPRNFSRLLCRAGKKVNQLFVKAGICIAHALAGPIVAAIDATRCPINRPLGSAANAARFYSKKDEAYCAKYDHGVSFPPESSIIYLSSAYPGGFADIEISRLELLPKMAYGEFVIADKGYQDDNEERILSPVKKNRNRPLNQIEEDYNRGINTSKTNFFLRNSQSEKLGKVRKS